MYRSSALERDMPSASFCCILYLPYRLLSSAIVPIQFDASRETSVSRQLTVSRTRFIVNACPPTHVNRRAMLRLCVLVTTATEQLIIFHIRACGTMVVCLLCV